MKQCASCKVTKEETEFNTGKGKCKLCQAKYFRIWYEQNHDKVLSYRRKYNTSPKGRAVLKKSKTKHKDRNLSRARLDQAVKQGRVIKPTDCTACKRHIALQAHHIDYEQPLLVIWLCRKCHNLLHRRIR